MNPFRDTHVAAHHEARLLVDVNAHMEALRRHVVVDRWCALLLEVDAPCRRLHHVLDHIPQHHSFIQVCGIPCSLHPSIQIRGVPYSLHPSFQIRGVPHTLHLFSQD